MLGDAVGLPGRILNYMEGLVVPQGRYEGQRFVVLDWEREFVEGVFGDPAIVDAGLSMGRGNAKTTFNAVLGCATIDVDGPLVQPAAETLIVASSFDQGLILFRYIQKMMRPTFKRYSKRYRIQDSANRAVIENRETSSLLRVVGSDPDRAHGGAVGLGLLDEVAKWPRSKVDRMIAAVETSRGKIPGSRVIWLGTRPESPRHPFSVHLAGGADYAKVYAARPGAPPFDRATWLDANPSLDHMPDLEAAIEREAEKAREQPSKFASFKALRLNLGTPEIVQADLVEPDAWERALGHAQALGPVSWGVDLGTSAAMSAIAAYHVETGRLDVVACYPELPSLGERGVQDAVGPLYEEMHQRGELIVAGRRVSDVPALIAVAMERWGAPSAITCDAWRAAELRDALEAAGLARTRLEVRHQGFKDGSADVREFRAAVLGGDVTAVPTLLLSAAMSEARTVADSNGNEKQAKSTEGGRRGNARDDAASAAILAVATGRRRREDLLGSGRGVRAVAV